MADELKYMTSEPDEQGLITITLERDGQEPLTLQCRDTVWDRPGFDRAAWLQGTAERLQNPQPVRLLQSQPAPRQAIQTASITARIETAVIDRPNLPGRTVPNVAQEQKTPPTDDEIAGAIAEVRRAVYDRGRSNLGSILKLSATPEQVEPAERLLTMTLENLQDHVERILCRTFTGVTHERVMAAHKALIQRT